jgi:hypothetical protein
MALPRPVLSYDDIVVIPNNSYQSATLIWNTWSKDPAKAAVLRAILSCRITLHHDYFGRDIAVALGQNWVGFLHFFSLRVQEVQY